MLSCVPTSPARHIVGLMFSAVTLLSASSALAQTVLHVYGPGGPAPAMKEAAAAFSKKANTNVEVTAGPTSAWIVQAKQNADVIYSGSETMMTDFTVAMEGRLIEQTIKPLYLRPLSILVRPGNPKRITGVKDLLKPGTNILVVNGAGQNGAWEDMAGRKGSIDTVRRLRSNIVNFAKNSAEARTTWISRTDIDAWLIWNIWQVSNPKLADVVAIEDDYVIYRDVGVGLTTHGVTRPEAKQFVEFLQSREGALIFKKWGWKE